MPSAVIARKIAEAFFAGDLAAEIHSFNVKIFAKLHGSKHIHPPNGDYPDQL